MPTASADAKVHKDASRQGLSDAAVAIRRSPSAVAVGMLRRKKKTLGSGGDGPRREQPLRVEVERAGEIKPPSAFLKKK